MACQRFDIAVTVKCGICGLILCVSWTLGFYFIFKYKSEKRLALYDRLFLCPPCFVSPQALPLPSYPFSTPHIHTRKISQLLGLRFFCPQGTFLILHPIPRCMRVGGFPKPPGKSPAISKGSTIQVNSDLSP